MGCNWCFLLTSIFLFKSYSSILHRRVDETEQRLTKLAETNFFHLHLHNLAPAHVLQGKENHGGLERYSSHGHFWMKVRLKFLRKLVRPFFVSLMTTSQRMT